MLSWPGDCSLGLRKNRAEQEAEEPDWLRPALWPALLLPGQPDPKLAVCSESLCPGDCGPHRLDPCGRVTVITVLCASRS